MARSSSRQRKQKPSSEQIATYEDYDSPWKEIIERFFPQLMHFFFPAIAEAIDWDKTPEFLDKELQRIAPRSKTGRQTVDKLVKVWRTNGDETWFLIHIEVQSQKDGDFPLRMYIYHYRIFDKYKRRAVSLAILGDDDGNWNPGQYEDELFGCKASLTFPTVKLLDYENQWQVLEENANPFAVVVMAHLKAIATRQKPMDRLGWKKTLIRGLYERGYGEQDVIDLFRFIDWIMKLPEGLETEIQAVVDEYEEAKQMRYVTSIERLAEKRGLEKGLEKGREEALRETILQILQFRFQPDADNKSQLSSTLALMEGEDGLKKLLNYALEASILTDFQTHLTEISIASLQQANDHPVPA